MASSTAHGPFFNGWLEINGVNLSNDCFSFSIPESAVVLPAHAHGDNSELQRTGLLQATVTGQLYTDFGAGKSYATLTSLYRNRTSFIWRARASAAAVSATNPQWSGSGRISELTQLQGNHGENLMTNFTIVIDTDIAVEES